MKESLKMILIYSISFIIIFVVFLISFVIFLNKNHFNYSSAKINAIKILKDNKKDLEKIAQEYLNDHDKKNSKYKNIIKSISYQEQDDNKFVNFFINSQGILDGQSYGLYYIENNEYNGQKDLCIDESDGNIFIYQKIDDNWFFYYLDYTGKVNLKDVKK